MRLMCTVALRFFSRLDTPAVHQLLEFRFKVFQGSASGFDFDIA